MTSAPLPEPVLDVERLTKRFGEAVAVDGISFRIARGEVLSLLGPSGCGKSTTLRVIAGIEHPDGGTIAIAGRHVAGNGAFVPSEKRDVGLVFQSYAIWPHMTVEQNVAFPLTVRRIPAAHIAERVRRVLEIVGLGGFEKRSATRLSGGQQQRVALARALVYEPPLLLLDEPLSNLDARLRDELRAELRRIQRELGLTLLYVTHDQVEAMTLSDRIAVMAHGRIVQIGAPAEVYDAPATRFVHTFFGRSIVLSGTVQSSGGDAWVLHAPGFRLPIPGTPGLASGTRAEVSMRVEDLMQAPGGTAAVDCTAFTADVQDVRLLGDRVECRVGLGAQTALIEFPRDSGIVAGQPLTLQIPRSRLRVWAAEPEG